MYRARIGVAAPIGFIVGGALSLAVGIATIFTVVCGDGSTEGVC